MQVKIQYSFTAYLWQYSSQGGWVFVSLPNNMSREIRESLKWQEEGWGRMKATACIENLEWKTAIWFDQKRKTYLLPIKADIRKKKNLELKKHIDIRIWI
ncbi:DUF1905 domain-containing protein [Muriicola sp. Z0-33]|uniref:DUF1905 domain-containing protein n=1 Tax=Muriicola sp. Z0-33 TaxID=2816957 RepID=UPI002238DB87|nr:DUF1905 domain-containing protein [Muriicola sp. Z0-33]MCW5518119.1 DUF1905 domain-containing protein [Muriicola sp. Z0-33]